MAHGYQTSRQAASCVLVNKMSSYRVMVMEIFFVTIRSVTRRPTIGITVEIRSSVRTVNWFLGQRGAVQEHAAVAG